MTSSEAQKLTILHFNDVYNISNSNNPVSGAARLTGLIKSVEAEGVNPLVLFSGDAFSPSSMTTVTLGAHMPPVLNTMSIQAACIGNHDFDLGLATCQSLVKQCNFPWMMSNVVDKESGELLEGLHESLLLQWNGMRIGLMGLVEGEWLETLSALDPDALLYKDFIQEGKRLANKLKSQGADLVIAITHMRVPNDRLLASSVPEIDLVLGGHDHHYEVAFIEPHNNLMVKSGTDFRDLTRIDISIPGVPAAGSPAGRPAMSWTRMPVALDSPQHAPTLQIVEEYNLLMGNKMDEVIGHTISDLDARFTTIRSAESNMGNLVADICKAAMGADLVILNSGTLRSDMIHPAGPLKLRDLVALLPMPDSMVLLEATGAQVQEALENGVSQVPRLEGRFPQVSGVRFEYDSRLTGGSRILPGSLKVARSQGTFQPPSNLCHWEDLQPDQTYKLAVKAYMAEGKDGYDVLAECKVLVDEEDGLVLSSAIRNHFRSLTVLNMFDPRVKITSVAKKWLSKVHHEHKRSDPVLAQAAAQVEQAGAAVDAATPAPAEAGSEGAVPGARRLISMPTRIRMTAAESGPCVLCLDHGYAIKPLVEGRMLDVAPPA